MSRVINPNSAGKERNRLKKGVVIALRELTLQKDFNSTSRDIAAFIYYALDGIDQTIEVATTAWEKRNYWLKADRFRLEWEWVKNSRANIYTGLVDDDVVALAREFASISSKVSDLKVSPRHRMGTPWIGAWEKFKNDFLQSS